MCSYARLPNQINIMYTMLKKCLKKDRNAFKQKEIKMIHKKKRPYIALKKKCIMMYYSTR